MQEVVIVAGVRTAIGDFGGSLKDFAPTALGAKVIAELLRRADVAPDAVEHVVMGNVIQTDPLDMYLARVAAVEAGIPFDAPALTLNRLCGSGLQAVVSAAQMLALGDCQVAVAGGAESMSRSGYLLPAARWGAKMGNQPLVDMMLGALNDPFGSGHMGLTAERVAASHGIDRASQDAFALASHRKASAAIAAGRFREQIMPIEITVKRETVAFAQDEHVRTDVSLDSLSALRPAFQKDGSVTAGNASGINDGAAALLLMTAAEAKRRGSTPMARIVGYAHSGVDPKLMGLGPIPAVQKLLARTGLKVADLDVIESNEAFAAQACAVNKALQLPPEKVNPNGGAVALGHPVGATGARMLFDAAKQVSGTAGDYQVENAATVQTLNIGGSFGTVVSFVVGLGG